MRKNKGDGDKGLKFGAVHPTVKLVSSAKAPAKDLIELSKSQMPPIPREITTHHPDLVEEADSGHIQRHLVGVEEMWETLWQEYRRHYGDVRDAQSWAKVVVEVSLVLYGRLETAEQQLSELRNQLIETMGTLKQHDAEPKDS